MKELALAGAPEGTRLGGSVDLGLPLIRSIKGPATGMSLLMTLRPMPLMDPSKSLSIATVDGAADDGFVTVTADGAPDDGLLTVTMGGGSCTSTSTVSLWKERLSQVLYCASAWSTSSDCPSPWSRV